VIPCRHSSTPCSLLSSAPHLLSVAGCFIQHSPYLDLMPIPSPPPPPPPPAFESVAPRPTPRPPTVPPDGPAGAFLVQLFVFNGSPFKDHWAYFVRSNARHTQGVVLHATGDVNNGFRLEFKRMHDLDTADEVPSEIIPLQWVDAQYFDETAMLNNGNPVIDAVPVCPFEASACKVKAPGKSLNSAAEIVGAFNHPRVPLSHMQSAWSSQLMVRHRLSQGRGSSRETARLGLSSLLTNWPRMASSAVRLLRFCTRANSDTQYRSMLHGTRAIDKKLQIPDTAGDLGRRRQQSCEGMYYCDQQ